MRMRAQLMMVMALDKCIGCHTCSVTCKQAWTDRDGAEYMWFNNVETKPGAGYPRTWEDQDRWQGGWRLDGKGRLALRAGGRLKKLATIFGNFDMPLIDDYYEPWTYDYASLVTAPAGPHLAGDDAALAPHGQASWTSQWGPNWEDDLAGSLPPDDPGVRGLEDGGAAALRAGLHVLPAAHLQPLREPIVRGVLSLRSALQARGGRRRAGRPGQVPRLALLRLGLPVQEGLLQPPAAARPRSASSAIRSPRTASPRCAPRPA